MSRNLNKLLNYSLLKISFIPIMLWIISSLVFILLRVAPGDPVDAILGSGADDKVCINFAKLVNNLCISSYTIAK